MYGEYGQCHTFTLLAHQDRWGHQAGAFTKGWKTTWRAAISVLTSSERQGIRALTQHGDDAIVV